MVGYSTVCRCFHELNLSRKRPRPQSMHADPDAQKDFIAEVKPLIDDPDTDVWFLDESGYCADPPLYMVWSPKGEKTVQRQRNTHEKCNVMGAVQPSDGANLTMIVSHGNAKLLQIFIDELHHYLDKKKKTVLILDNAKLHVSDTIRWGKIKPLFLPPYSPELNPIEELWLRMKKWFFTGRLVTQKQPLDEQVFRAMKFFDLHPELVKTICAMSVYY